MLLVTVAVLAGCREFPVEPDPGQAQQNRQTFSVEPGEPFTFRVDDVVHVEGTNTSVQFRLVAEDSRCPGNVECIHPGRASILLILTNSVDDAEYQLLASIPGLVESPYLLAPVIQFESLTFRLTNLSPYPLAGVDTRRGEYAATMNIDIAL